MKTLLSEAKPGFEAVRERWNHYWAGDVLERPLVTAEVRKPGAPRVSLGGRYRAAIEGRWDEYLERVDQWLAGTLFLAESVPSHAPDFGPDQFAAFFGGDFKLSEDSGGTSWVPAFVDDWESVLPLVLDENNKWWQRILAYSRRIREHAAGRYLVGVCDLHSNADALLAMRAGERLCMDFIETPDLVERAMHDVRAAYAPIYNGLYEAGGMSRETGTTGWTPFWCEGRFATIQCDFICMVSPEMARRTIIPALEEEAGFLDHCVYHLDGPGALPHLDDILGIEAIDTMQWVSGAGQPPMHTWTDVLLRCQRAGKGLQIYGLTCDEAREVHRLLDPRGVVYSVNAGAREEVEEFCKWLERHT